MSVLIFADSTKGKVTKSGFEVINYGKKIADKTGTKATVLVAGECSNINNLGNYGASKILHAKTVAHIDSQVLTKVIAGAVALENADIIIFSHDLNGKAVAPMLAAKLNAGIVTGAVGLPKTEGGFAVKKAVFSGKAFAEVKITSPKKIISLLPNSFQVERVRQ